MGLKQDIVVVNEYTIKNKSGKGGSRGGSPGNYVLRYMSREGATELSTPVTLNNEDYVERYMARRSAVEKAGSVEDMARHVRAPQKMGGVAFSQDGLSLSHVALVKSSRDIQKGFDAGKTVMKTVISFDSEYLRANGIIPDDFVFTRRGDFRGNIDQMKLRYAISRGMEMLAHDYDDLRYVGVIQVDTAHVHCHLAMIDMGDGNLAGDGTQKGKLSERNKLRIRRGIDLALDEAKEIQYMASQSGIDRRNVQTNLKRYTYEQVVMYGAPQRILSLLPDDERQWRAGSNARSMKAANKLCQAYVEHILYATPDSGMDKAMSSVRQYADARQRREGLTDEEHSRLVANGRKKLVEGCMNSVYATFRQIPKNRRNVSTVFLDIAGDEDLTPDFKGGAQDMLYRMGAYTRRLKKHRDSAKRFQAFKKDFEAAGEAGMASEDARMLYDFFRVETEYHEKLSAKYSRFLFFERPSDVFTDEYLELARRGEQVAGMEQLQSDSSVKNMKADNAEDYGRQRYGVYGGRFLSLDSVVYQARLDKLRNKYNSDNKSFLEKLAACNLGVVPDGKGRYVIGRKETYPFDDIKGLDLHDIRGDFGDEFSFSNKIAQDFVQMAKLRVGCYDRACEYLDRSGQGGLKSVFDIQDIENMRMVLTAVESGAPVPPVIHEPYETKPKKVIPIDRKMHRYLCGVAAQSVRSFDVRQTDEEMGE